MTRSFRFYCTLGLALLALGQTPAWADDPIDEVPPDTIGDLDTDQDGILNLDDTDMDGDNVRNEIDDDMDGDGLVNEQDPDDDNNGVPDADPE